MTQTIQVVALVVDKGILSFYKTDGTVYPVTQSDPRGRAMTDEFMSQRRLGKKIIELTVGDDDKTVSVLESGKRNKLIRFFRAPLKAVMDLFGKTSEDPEWSEETHEAAAAKVREIAGQLMTNNPAIKSELPVRLVTSEEPLQEHETVIAVTQDGIVPHIENLTDQFQAADESKTIAEGVDNLLIRVAKISAKRGHAGADLLKFLKGGDLPIFADGSYVAYKRLKVVGDGVYADPYTGNVYQRIGDTVEMEESMVDSNRSRDCSNGLHIGSRAYMGGFNPQGGTMLVLVQPEDTIAVPTYGTTKMRVCRYTILGDLSQKAHNLINSNKAMDDCKETMDLLARLAAGARPPVLGVVKINGSLGSKLTYTINGKEQDVKLSYQEALNISEGKAKAPTKAVEPVRTIKTELQGNLAAMPREKIRDKASIVNPKELKAQANKPVTKSDIAQDLAKTMRDTKQTDAARLKAAQDLLALKKKAKISWNALGFVGNIPEEIEEIITLASPSKPKEEPTKQAAEVKAQPEPKAEPAKPVTTATAPSPKVGLSRQERARQMWDRIKHGTSDKTKTEAAKELRDFKKTAKVSWTALGLGAYDVEGTLTKYLG